MVFLQKALKAAFLWERKGGCTSFFFLCSSSFFSSSSVFLSNDFVVFVCLFVCFGGVLTG